MTALADRPIIPDMKIVVAALVAPLMFISGLPAWSVEELPAENAAPADPVVQSRAEKLDAAFEALKSATDETSANRAESEIITLWLQSGSDTVDLLMTWSLQAIEDKDYATALDFLDRIVTLKPDYAEGWNKRATVYYLTDKYSLSVADIERVLVIEPRHFGALSGLGSIFREIGDDKRAMEAYGQALALDPHLESVKKALKELEKDTVKDI